MGVRSLLVSGKILVPNSINKLFSTRGNLNLIRWEKIQQRRCRWLAFLSGGLGLVSAVRVFQTPNQVREARLVPLKKGGESGDTKR